MTHLLAALGANQQPLALPHIQYRGILPEVILTVGAVVILLLSSLVRERIDARVCAFLSTVVSLASMVAAIPMWREIAKKGAHTLFSGALAEDHFTVFFNVVIGSALVLSILISSDWLSERNIRGPEYFVLMMLSAAGAMIMAQANDLIVVFLGLEVLSIALYVLVGFDTRSEGSREGAIKYFVLGGFSSAIFLYGIALTYGASGSTNLATIANFLSQNTLVDYGLMLAGMTLLAVGFAFKVAAVPFHQWTPDVYQGAPTPVTAFMAAAAKAGAFAALLRVFASSLFTMKLDWQPMFLAVAVLTLLVGSVAACVQMNVKRMLAYSSISHAGYVLIGLQAGTLDGVSGSMYYLLAYTFMVVGSFAIVSVVGGQENSEQGIEAFRGLGRRQPVLAFAFTVLLLAQAGVPLTSGFLAKFFVISAQVENGSYATAVFAMVVTAIAAFFYLRVVVAMYTAEAHEADSDPVSVGSAGSALLTTGYVSVPPATQIALVIAVIFTLGMGILPPGEHNGDYVINAIKFAHQSATDFFSQ
jgi:NADH-quinone oxidoreductase subunit N